MKKTTPSILLFIVSLLLTFISINAQTAPDFLPDYPKTYNIRDDKFTLVVQMDMNCTVYHVTRPAADPALNRTEILAGDAFVATANDSAGVIVTGLDAETDYKIYILACNDEAVPDCQEDSTVLEITTTPPRSLDLTSPVGGNTYFVGDSAVIEWTSANIDSFMIWIYDPQVPHWFDPTNNNPFGPQWSGYKLPIPLDAGTDSVNIRIADAQDTTFCDESGFLYLADTIDPEIISLSPPNEEVNVDTSPSLEIIFNERVFKGDEGTITIRKKADDSEVESIQIGNTKITVARELVTISPSVPLDVSTEYYVEISPGTFTDFQDNEFPGIAGNDTWSFTTIPDNEAEILNFILDQEAGEAVINSVNATVEVELLYGTQADSLFPEITVSPGAVIDPASGDSIDLTNPVTYTVTAEDGTTTKEWTVTASEAEEDLIPPAFIDPFPLIKKITTEGFEIAVQLNEKGRIYYLVQNSGDPAPQKQDVLEGGTIPVEQDSLTFRGTITGLTAGAAYDVYLIAEDNQLIPNVQDELRVLKVTLKTPVITDDLIISEYIEGSDNNKAIEIYNGTGSDIDLSEYALKQSNNGAGWGRIMVDETPVDSVVYVLQLTGTLPDGDVHVIYNAGSREEIIRVGDTVTTYDDSTPGSRIAAFNGDDAIGLFKNEVLIDAIGYPDEDPGNAWDVAGVDEATVDHTLARKLTVTSGNTDWSVSAGTDAGNSEWVVYEQDNFDYLGFHGEPTGNTKPGIHYILTEPEKPDETDEVIIKSYITDADGIITDAILAWGTESGHLINIIPMMVLTGDTAYSAETAIPAREPVTTVYYMITATDDDNESTGEKASYTIPLNVSISDIQFTTDPSGDSPYLGTFVSTSGYVTAVKSDGFFIQDSVKAWNGIFVYDNGDNDVQAGDSVTLSGTVDENSGLTVIKNIDYIQVDQIDHELPPVVLNPDEVTEPYESVLITILDGRCTDADAGDGMWEISDGEDTLLVDDDIFHFEPVSGSTYTVTGIGYHSTGGFRILLRSADDITEYVPENEAPEISGVTITPETIYEDDDISITATITDDTYVESNSVYLFYGYSAGDYPNKITIERSDINGDVFEATIPAQDPGITVYYKITVNDSDTDDPKSTDYEGSFYINLPVATEELLISDEILIYPNPSEGIFFIRLPDNLPQTYTIEIIARDGSIVYKNRITNHSEFIKINSGDLNKGLFYISFLTENDRITGKLIIK